jgi:hypothetical protein
LDYRVIKSPLGDLGIKSYEDYSGHI